MNNARFAVSIALVALIAVILVNAGATTPTLTAVLIPATLAAVGFFGYQLVKRVRAEGITFAGKTVTAPTAKAGI